jgi:hypothetical protein
MPSIEPSKEVVACFVPWVSLVPTVLSTKWKQTDLLLLMGGIWKVLRRNLKTAKGEDVKLADGLSGLGNAILDLKEMQDRLSCVNEASQLLLQTTLC